jgi:putative tryptophan/tyrosine transport system substrate-binding protein
MRRREFITLFSGAATWPLAARAQQPERMRRIGVLTNANMSDPDRQASFETFVDGLRQAGWVEDRNLHIDMRWGGGHPSEIKRHTEELVALAPDALVAIGSAAVLAFLQRHEPFRLYSTM